MKNSPLKVLILILAIFSAQYSFSQKNKFSLSIEYSPNFSKLSDEILDKKYKLSHNALLRIEYNTNTKFRLTVGLGFFNTGELEYNPKSNLRPVAGIGILNTKEPPILETYDQLGLEQVKFINNYNYLIVPFGVRINLGGFYFLPELGFGIKLSNKTKTIIKYKNGEREKITKKETLNFGEFNKISIPLSLSLGKQFKIANKSFSTGLKGYYGINKVVNGVSRNNHYYGVGIIIGMNL